MAVGNCTLLNKAKLKIVNGTIALASHTINAGLLTATQTIDATFAGSSTDARWSDVSANEITGTGYTAGGVALTGVSVSGSTGTVSFNSSAVVWASSTLSAKWMVLYDATNANKDIIAVLDLNNASGSSVANDTSGTFTVTPNAGGWFQIA